MNTDIDSTSGEDSKSCLDSSSSIRFLTSNFSQCNKQAVLRPLLKKPGLDVYNTTNYIVLFIIGFKPRYTSTTVGTSRTEQIYYIVQSVYTLTAPFKGNSVNHDTR